MKQLFKIKNKILIISTIFLSSCFDLLGDTKTTLVKTLSNQSETKKAVLLHNNGNATVDFSLQVSILEKDYKLTGKEGGNVFVVDRDHGETVLDSSSINFVWLSNDTLKIDYDKKLRTFIQEKNMDGVTIIYIPR